MTRLGLIFIALLVGGLADATVLKIATNMISAATGEILAEALAVTRSQDIAAEKLTAVQHGRYTHTTVEQYADRRHTTTAAPWHRYRDAVRRRASVPGLD